MSESMSRHPFTILCIDDDWNALMGRKIFLEKNGYRVIESSDGVEALRLFCKLQVDAVIVDYQMPGIGGDAIAARMKVMKADVPILLLSSYGPLPEKKLRSVDTFLAKADEPKLLVSALGKLLSRPQPFFNRWLSAWRGRNRTVLS